jgi:hypothetical protein
VDTTSHLFFYCKAELKKGVGDMTAQLTSHDLGMLAKSFITPEIAQQARLYRVNSIDGANLVGRNGGGDYSGIAFPYYWPGEDSPREFRLRRDRPEFELKDGVLKEKNKYLSPPGRGNRFYIPYGTPVEYLSDSSIPVAITEGEKKALSLYRYFIERGESALVIGLSGVWGWRGVVGKTADEKGARCDVKGPIPDFDQIVWNKRTTNIFFDSNVATNEKVKSARNALVKELERRGSLVHPVDLPQIEGVNGVDDLLGIKGPEFIHSLIADAQNRPSQSEKGEKPQRKSQATVLLGLTGDVELFHTAGGEGYASVPLGGHLETWPLKSRGFRDWLVRRFYETEGSAPSSQALQDALGVLNGRARFDGDTCEVHIRLAEHEGSIYLDLCDEGWRSVRITQDDWSVIEDAPVKFRRTRGMLPLPQPIRGGDPSILRPFINVADYDWPLVLAWLVTVFRPGRPFPILALHGEQGSAKSTTTQILRSLTDPNKAALRSEPRDERDLMIAATNGWVIALNNLSRIQPWLSDALCRLATGGGFATRELYANDEEVLFDAMRPVVLNGIEELATRSDLLDRSMVLNLPTIPEDKRRPEAEVWREFEAARPAILGALLGAVSHALRNLESTHMEKLPRMADFALWATAAESGLGLTPGTFIETYMGNRESANDLALEASPVAPAVIAFVEREKLWTGTATNLLKELNSLAGDEAQRQQGWPKRGNVLSGILKRLAPNLRAAGVNFSRLSRSDRKGSRRIQLEHVCKQSSVSSESSESAKSSTNFPTDADDASDSDNSSDTRRATPPVQKTNATSASDNLTSSDDISQIVSKPSPSIQKIDATELAERTAEIIEMCGVPESKAHEMALAELTTTHQAGRIFGGEGKEYFF